MVLAPERKKFTLTQYHQMGFLNHEPTEFLDGEIYSITASKEYDTCLNHVYNLLTSKLGDSFAVNKRNSLVIDNDELRPDIEVLRGSVVEHCSENIALIVEIGDNSLGHFQKLKIPKYASKDLQEPWVIDLSDELIWVYRRPSGDTYLTIKAYQHGETLTSLAFPGITITVNEILGEKY